MAVAHNALAAVVGLEISMLGEKIRDLGLDRLRHRTSPLPQDFGELIVRGSWLNQFEHVIVGHGISLLQWRSGVVKHPTFSDSSPPSGKNSTPAHPTAAGTTSRLSVVSSPTLESLVLPQERREVRAGWTFWL